jgi:tetratricopeptide (TPR) repeat protein
MAHPPSPDDAKRASAAAAPSAEGAGGARAGGGGIEQSFQAALRAAELAPASDDAWAHVEDLVEQLGRPDELAALYRQLLERKLPPETWSRLSERAAQFHEAWFGEAPDRITALLGRIVELDPEADWAFERLNVMLTSAAQWDALLALYDRALGRTQDADKRRRLLNDAAQVAKDFADQADRAADYLQQLLLLEPANVALATSLERLLERLGRYHDLIELWLWRLPQLGGEEARQTRIRVAACWLEQLGKPARGLDALRELLDHSPGDLDACRLLERILADAGAEPEARRTALSLLRKGYLVAERPDDVVRILELALGFVEAEERRPLHREAGMRLAILGRDVEAIDHYRALLVADPSDPDARKQIRQLAQRSGRHDLHAAALVAAAEAADAARRVAVLLEAAHLHRTALADGDGATELYRRVLDAADVDRALALEAAHSLSELLDDERHAPERLAVLERLAELERSSAVRRQTHAEAARLAERLGLVDRALANWAPVLERGSHDLEALTAVVQLLHASGSWDKLVEALEQRAAAPVPAQQRRADLVHVAEVQAKHLGRADDAIGTWLRIRDEFGDDAQTLAALDDLMTARGRTTELSDLLAGAATHERERVAKLLGRLGDLLRLDLGDPDRALRWYVEGLALDPRNAAARAGLAGLIGVPSCTAEAGRALASAHQATDEPLELLGLLEPRLASTPSRREQSRLLREAAEIQLARADRPADAAACLARALPLEPDNLALEAQLVAVAERAGTWSVAAAALADAAAAALAAGAPRRAADLRCAAARIHEARLGDDNAALDAYQAALAAADDVATHEAVVRCAARAGRWAEACRAAVASVARRDRVAVDLVAALEAGAREPWQWSGVAGTMAAEVAAVALRPELAQQLLLVATRWLRDCAQDLDGAERLAERAVALRPSELTALTCLCGLQRRRPDATLLATLMRIDALEEDSLDALDEAARLALDLESDVVQTQAILERLYRKAGGMWLRQEPARGQRDPGATAVWALDKLVAYHVLHGNAERAVQVLVDGARLPIEVERAVDLRRRAAEILAEAGEASRAIDVYRAVLDARPRDPSVLQRVAELCEAEGRVSEALGLRLRELELTQDPSRRLALRLEHSRLTGALEAQGGRVQALVANLEEAPGHEETIAELARVLEERGRHRELADMFGKQAKLLEAAGDGERAAAVWGRVAALAETPLGEVELAIAALRRVVELAPQNDALDALARLHLGREEPGEAARWLERRLERSSAAERVPVLVRLARARLRAEDRAGAVDALERAFEEAPRNAEVRKLLLGLHRSGQAWDRLAAALSFAAQHVSDGDTVLAYAREAADLYHRRLGAPEKSVAVLRRALEHAPDDRDLRSLCAEALRAAGELVESKKLLEGLVQDFGRRRSPERAQIHRELARVAHALGQTDEALDHLDNASRMDPSNVGIAKALAELARDAGQLDRAERAYRTLLVTVRREEGREGLPIGPAEVLLELSRLGAARGQVDKAAELAESVLEALAQHDQEAPRVQDRLRQVADWALLGRVLDKRLGYVTVPHRRAQILAEQAEVLEAGLGRPADALAARLEAVRTDPSSPVHHEAARDLARRLDRASDYAALVEGLIADERAEASAHVRCELLLRLTELAEERSDLARAAELLERAEQTGVRQVDVWRAGARLAAAQGDQAGQVRLLERLASLGEDQAETRADALYRLGEVQLAGADSLEEGIASMGRALADAFRAERAALVLGRACDQHPHHDGLLDLYEQVARRGGDRRVLLHYLERRARHPDATPEQAREAVDVARELGEAERAEQLMLRAAEIGRTSLGPDALQRVDWALLGLAELRMRSGDVAGAVRWLSEAAEVADVGRLFALGRQVAEIAATANGDLTLAAKLYERLLERSPTAREAWQPLAEIYRKLQNLDRLERLVEETLDGLEDAADKQALRLELARALLAEDARVDQAVAVLEQVLGEDPEHAAAQALLGETLERQGRTDELAALLERQLEAAEARGDGGAVKSAALRLGARLVSEGALERGLAAYRRALASNPEDAELLTVLLGAMPETHDARERAGVCERLVAVEPAAPAARRALGLADLYDSLGDGDAALRALRLGCTRAPDDATLRTTLQERYRARCDWTGLADSLADAARLGPEIDRAALLREAAALHRERLADAARAAELLAAAVELTPDDAELRIELATTLGAAGDAARADETLSHALAGTPPGARERRLALLRARAGVRRGAGDDAGALADLEQAFEIDPESVASELEEVLELHRAAAARSGEAAGERRFTMRSVDVLLVQGKRGPASDLLAAWTDRAPDDAEALRRLRDVNTAEGRWEAVATCCERLVELEAGAAQVEAALGLARAYGELGRTDEARTGLECAYRQQRSSGPLRMALRHVYEHVGDQHALAHLLVEDAADAEKPDAKIAQLVRAGQIFLSLGDAVSAVPALRQAVGLGPGDPDVVILLADGYIMAGWFDDAGDLLDEAITAAKGRRTPDVCLFYHRKALIAQAQGDRRKQLANLQEAHLCNKKHGQVAADLANLAEELEDWDLAAKTLRTITLMDSECPIGRGEAFYRQGRIAHRLGKQSDALMWARRARREDPDSVEIINLLRELGEKVSLAPPPPRRG